MMQIPLHCTYMQKLTYQTFLEENYSTSVTGWDCENITQSQIPKVKSRAWLRAEEFKGNRKTWHPSTNFLSFTRDTTDNRNWRWLQTLERTLYNRGQEWSRQRLSIQKAIIQAVEKPNHSFLWFFHPEMCLHLDIKDEDERKCSKMIFKSVNFATWSAVLLSTYNGPLKQKPSAKNEFERFPVDFNYPCCLPWFYHW